MTAATSSPVAGPAADPRPGTAPATAPLPRTLGAAARIFWRAASPWIVAGLIVAAGAGRLAAGGFNWVDLAVVAGLIAWQPFQEWLIHVFVLHWRPKRLLGRVLDTEIAKRHRHHHEHPSDLPMIFMPLRGIAFSIATNAAIFLAVLPAPRHALTALFMVSAIGLAYEWTHFLIHTSYAPKGALFRRLWRMHRLHHYKNEGYWFGVTAHLGDRVLGTAPDPKDVPLSPTARTLGVGV